jgi:8-oxo-dGTP pyrophosphatase MutT (NUDIX family)
MPDRSELIDLLTAYRPADPDEQRFRMEMLDLAAAAGDPFDRHHYLPGHFTASGFVVHPAGDRVLLVHHAKLDLWLQPGGHVEPVDATLLDAAVREITEETDLGGLRPVTDAIFDIDIHVFPERADQPEHRHYDLRFAFVAVDDVPAIGPEILDFDWLDLGAAHRLGVDRSVIRPMTKILAEGITSDP